VIAVDLVGCGRLYIAAAKSDYTLARHYDWDVEVGGAGDEPEHHAVLSGLGGTIGIHRLPSTERFDRVVAANTGLPLGEGENEFMKMWVGIMKEATEFPWHASCRHDDEADRGRGCGLSCTIPDFRIRSWHHSVSSADRRAEGHAGAPLNREAWKRLASFDKPFLTLFGELYRLRADGKARAGVLQGRKRT